MGNVTGYAIARATGQVMGRAMVKPNGRPWGRPGERYSRGIPNDMSDDTYHGMTHTK